MVVVRRQFQRMCWSFPLGYEVFGADNIVALDFEWFQRASGCPSGGQEKRDCGMRWSWTLDGRAILDQGGHV